MTRLKPIIVAAILVLGIANSISAQSKPGCDPKSCGPDNTKVAEARVITDLRAKLQASIVALGKSSLSFSPELVKFTIPKGTSDDESLLFITQAAAKVKAELLARVPSNKITTELRELQEPLASNKQQMLLHLKKEIEILSAQIASI